MSDHTKHRFADRHIGPRRSDVDRMLAALGYDSLDALARTAVPLCRRDQPAIMCSNPAAAQRSPD